MATRYGCVLTFRAGVSKRQIADALRSIRSVLDLPSQTTAYVDAVATYADHKRNPYIKVGQKIRRATQRTLRVGDVVKEFDDSDGGPVWYIP